MTPKRIFDLLESEKGDENRYEDEYIASNLYLVSLPNALGMIAGHPSEERKKTLIAENEWLRAEIPDVDRVYTLNFDQIKNSLRDSEGLRSCDAFFYHPDSKKKCFLIEFKRVNKRELLNFIKVKDSGDEQIIRKAHDSEYVLSHISFDDTKAEKNIAERTHLIIVYNGQNTTASSIAVSKKLPKKTEVAQKNGRQSHAAKQDKQREVSEREIKEATVRFSNYIHSKQGFCAITKSEFPGSAYPREFPRFVTFMTVRDFSRSVDALFSKWDWGAFLPYLHQKFETRLSEETNESEREFLPV